MQNWFNGLMMLDAQSWMIALAILCLLLVATLLVLLLRGKNERDALSLTLAEAQETLLQQASAQNKEATRQVLSEENTHLRMELNERLNSLTHSQRNELMQFSQLVSQMGQATTETSTKMRQEMTMNLTALTNSIKAELAEVRNTMNAQIENMRTGNEKKLDQMRLTVEEKLQSTLETRLTESFKQVAAQLKEVETGLGEMRHLAGQVGELKRVLTNVKTRGTFGEMQLGAILEDILRTSLL